MKIVADKKPKKDIIKESTKDVFKANLKAKIESLGAEINSLNKFIDSPEFKKIEGFQQVMLQAQSPVMIAYHSILVSRHANI